MKQLSSTLLQANMSVWGDKNSFGSNNDRSRNQNSGDKLSCGAFGSNSNWTNSGPASMPFMSSSSQNCHLNRFEPPTNCPPSGHSSLIFGVEQKGDCWNSSSSGSNGWSFSSSNQYKSHMSCSGGSSRNSSGPGSIDMSGTVEGVFRDEIRMMAEGNINMNYKF